MKKLMEQIMKFGIVGVLCFVIDYAVYSVLVMASVHHLIANFFSFTISVIVNYLLSMKYVFARRENLDRRAEFILFVVLSVIGLLLSEFLIWLCVDVFYADLDWLNGRFSLKSAKLAAKVFATAVVMVYNFVTRKIFLEKKNDISEEH